jgi:hypothetical protein
MPPPDHLAITVKDAKEPFRILKSLCKPKPGEEAVLSFDGACLHIECSGVTVAPGATGEWSGQARVLGTSLMSVVKHPPPGDPLVFSITDGLTINSITIPCVWQQAWSKKIELPVNYTLEDVAILGDSYTEQEIIESGLGDIYKRAVLEFPRRARNGTFKKRKKPEDPLQMHFWN